MRVIGLLPAGAEIEVASFAHPVCIGAIKFEVAIFFIHIVVVPKISIGTDFI